MHRTTKSRTLTTALVIPLALGLSIGACGDDSGPTGVDGDGAVSGEVQETSDPPSSSSASPARNSSDGGAAEASTVAVGTVQSDGSLDVLAEADVEADGSYTIQAIPAGRSDLVVVARSEAGADVGRVLVHGETRSGVTIRVAPIEPRTTARGRIHAHLHSSGRSDAARGSSEMALVVRFDSDAAARAVATTQAQIDAMADAYAEARATMTRVLAEIDTEVDARARAEAYAEAAVAFSQALDAGSSVSAAHEAYAEAAVDALVDAGASLESLTEATAASATAFAQTSVDAGADAAARVGPIRALSSLNLRVREHLAAAVESGSSLSSEAEAVAGALATVRASLDGLSAVTEISTQLQAALSSSQTIVVDGVLALASDLSTTQRASLEAALEDAFATADLQAALEGSTSASALAGACGTYHAQVETAAQAVVDAMAASSASVSTETMVRLLLAAGAGGNVS